MSRARSSRRAGGGRKGAVLGSDRRIFAWVGEKVTGIPAFPFEVRALTRSFCIQISYAA